MHLVEKVSPIFGDLSRTITSTIDQVAWLSFRWHPLHRVAQTTAKQMHVLGVRGPWRDGRAASRRLDPTTTQTWQSAGHRPRRGCRGAKGPFVNRLRGRCHPSSCPARPRGAKCRSLAGCVRSPQEGGKEAGGAFTTRRGPDRSDKEEGSRRRCVSELTTPQTAGVLQLASRRGLQKWRPREGRLRPLPAICRKPR